MWTTEVMSLPNTLVSMTFSEPLVTRVLIRMTQMALLMANAINAELRRSVSFSEKLMQTPWR